MKKSLAFGVRGKRFKYQFKNCVTRESHLALVKLSFFTNDMEKMPTWKDGSKDQWWYATMIFIKPS